MDDNKLEIISKTYDFVAGKLADADGAHDMLHIERVVKNAKLIASKFDCDINLFIVEMGALLHDMSDYKLFGDEKKALDDVKVFLESVGVCSDDVFHLLKIIPNVSFSARFSGNISCEFDIVSDADRLDALGAVGIARCFTFGGARGNPIYLPDVKPNLNMSKEEYKKSVSPQINHFYEKLLLIADLMKTDSGKKLGCERTEFMKTFLSQFFDEWEGKN
jgi:uncharacterized protein